MATFEVWSEGYAVTGGSGPAQLIGTVEAPTFTEACQAVMADKDERLWGRFDPERLTVWGCRLFATEAEARKSFG